MKAVSGKRLSTVNDVFKVKLRFISSCRNDVYISALALASVHV